MSDLKQVSSSGPAIIERLRVIVARTGGTWGNMGPGQRQKLLVLGVFALYAAATLIYWALRPDWRVLY